jgi:hypothetical protein
MNSMGRRLGQLEAAQSERRMRIAWRPEDLPPDAGRVWLNDLRQAEGWGETDPVMILSWMDAAEPAPDGGSEQ